MAERCGRLYELKHSTGMVQSQVHSVQPTRKAPLHIHKACDCTGHLLDPQHTLNWVVPSVDEEVPTGGNTSDAQHSNPPSVPSKVEHVGHMAVGMCAGVYWAARNCCKGQQTALHNTSHGP